MYLFGFLSIVFFRKRNIKQTFVLLWEPRFSRHAPLAMCFKRTPPFCWLMGRQSFGWTSLCYLIWPPVPSQLTAHTRMFFKWVSLHQIRFFWVNQIIDPGRKQKLSIPTFLTNSENHFVQLKDFCANLNASLHTNFSANLDTILYYTLTSNWRSWQVRLRWLGVAWWWWRFFSPAGFRQAMLAMCLWPSPRHCQRKYQTVEWGVTIKPLAAESRYLINTILPSYSIFFLPRIPTHLELQPASLLEATLLALIGLICGGMQLSLCYACPAIPTTR